MTVSGGSCSSTEIRLKGALGQRGRYAVGWRSKANDDLAVGIETLIMCACSNTRTEDVSATVNGGIIISVSRPGYSETVENPVFYGKLLLVKFVYMTHCAAFLSEFTYASDFAFSAQAFFLPYLLHLNGYNEHCDYGMRCKQDKYHISLQWYSATSGSWFLCARIPLAPARSLSS